MKNKELKTRVSHFEIGRCFNLGNYENVTYKIAVDVPEGKSASLALRHVMMLLKCAKPKPPIPTYDYEHAKSQLSDPEKWHKNVKPESDRKKAIREMVKSAKANVKLYETWIARRRAAEKMLDNIGATKVFKDSKLSWDDDNYDY